MTCRWMGRRAVTPRIKKPCTGRACWIPEAVSPGSGDQPFQIAQTMALAIAMATTDKNFVLSMNLTMKSKGLSACGTEKSHLRRCRVGIVYFLILAATWQKKY